MKLSLFLLLISFCIGSNCRADSLPSWCGNLSGASLKEAVKANSSPAIHISTDNTFDLNFSIEETDDSIISLFSNTRYHLSMSAVYMTQRRIVPEEWFRNGGTQTRQHALGDMINIYPCEPAISELLQDNMPGEPITTTWTNGTISIGADEKGQGVWSFPESAKGEFARVFFYMATIYPMDLWGSRGILFMSDGSFPSFSEEAIELLLGYHTQYPPTEHEKHRNNLIEKIQGNRNPFVDYPELANLIWRQKTEPDIPSEWEDEPDDSEEIIPLKGFYALDEKIWLVSPFIPTDALWKIDGTEINEKSVPASALGNGKHLLEYTSKQGKGKVFIEVAE